MSRIDDTLKDIKAAAFDLGIPRLAQEAGVAKDSVRRLLKKPPTAIENLKALEEAAARLRASSPQSTQP